MGGRIDFEGPANQRILSYQAASGPPLRIQAAASLIRSLAGFDLYLAHPLREIIVIDEPEMNAHPEAQLQLVELFAMLVNKGMKIVLTTHSPYLLDHLNNLVEAAKLPPDVRTRIATKTKLRDAGAFISIDQVAAYHFKDDGTVDNIIQNGILDVQSFASESDYVGNLFSQIQEALAESTSQD
jgi:hypothetical protein